MRPEALFIDGPWDGKMRQIAGPGPIHALMPPMTPRDARFIDTSRYFVYRIEMMQTPTWQFYIGMPIHMSLEDAMRRLIEGYHKCPKKTSAAAAS